MFYFLIKNDKFLLISVIYVFILDAGNGLFPLPLREIVFVILMFKLFYYASRKKIGSKTSLPILIISILIPLYGFTVSAFRGNNLSYAFDDSKGYIFLLTSLGLYSLIRRNEHLKTILIKHIFIASLIVSITTITILILELTSAVSIYDSGLWLRDYNLGFAGIEINGQYRIFMRAQIYVMFSLILAASMYFLNSKKKKRYFWLTIIFLSCIIISNTRGLWLGTGIGFATNLALVGSNSPSMSRFSESKSNFVQVEATKAAC